MSTMNFGRFGRIMKRSADIAAEPNMDASVGQVYHGVLEASASAYLVADASVTTALSTSRKDEKEMKKALVAFDAPYRVARSTVAAFVPGIELPDTLKAQKTDTDRVTAVEGLLKALNDNTNQAWASTLLQGDFGQKAAATMQKIKNATASSTALSHAREGRAAAYDEAYPRYIQFKRVVRDACGQKSKEYKRIHIRDEKADAETQAAGATATTAPSVPTAAVPATPATTNGPSTATSGSATPGGGTG